MNVKEAREKAEEYINKHGEDGFSMRSCWKCNKAHEGLKKADYVISCFVCGQVYYKGVNITEK